MRAAIYNGKESILLTELDTPEAGENDIVVRNLYASICGTDVAVYRHGPNTGHRITVGGFSEYVLIPNAEPDKQVYKVPDRISSKEASLIGSGGYFPEDVRDVLKIMESERWNIESIITHEFPWEQLPEAIEKAGNVNVALNVVIRY